MKVKIDTSEYISNLKQLIADNHSVVLTVMGWSMMPFLRHQEDRVLLTKTSGLPKVGDIVFYQRKTGQYVLHRIYQHRIDGYYIMGDHQLDLEGPIEPSAIFAIVTEVERNGHWILTNSFWWKSTSYIWRLLYPLRKLGYMARKVICK